MAPKRLLALRRETIAQIDAAFAAIPYPGDDNIAEATQKDDDYFQTIDFLTGKHWKDAIPKRRLPENRSNSLSYYLCFSTDEAFRYFMPAYLITGIKWDKIDVFHLKPPKGGRLYEWRARRHAGFNAKQCRAIVAYLDYVKASLAAEKEAYPNFARSFARKIQEADTIRYYWSELAKTSV